MIPSLRLDCPRVLYDIPALIYNSYTGSSIVADVAYDIFTSSTVAWDDE
jgi:hypothetical protein